MDVVDDVVWLDGGKSFTWVSDRDGWNHVYVVSRDGKKTRLVTKGDFDVLDMLGIDTKGGWLYYVASPENPAQRYLFRTRLDGKGKPERLSPAREPGTHVYDVAPSYRYAIETYSSLGNPPIIRLVRLPGPPVRSGRWWTTSAPRPGQRAPPRRGRVAQHRRRGRRADARRPDEAGGLRLHPQVSAALLRLRRARQHRGPTTSGAATICGTRCSPRRATWSRSWTTAARRRRWASSSARRSTARWAWSRPGTRPRRPARCCSGPTWTPRGWASGAGATARFMALNALFQHPRLYRTAVAVSPVTHWALYDNVYTERYNGLITDNREGYDRGLAAELREGPAGQPAADPRRRRRQRALPEQRDADQRAGGGQPAVRDDGVPQPDPLHLPGQGHHGAPLRPGDPVPRSQPAGGGRP